MLRSNMRIKKARGGFGVAACVKSSQRRSEEAPGAETFRRGEEEQRVGIAGVWEGAAGINGETDSSAPEQRRLGHAAEDERRCRFHTLLQVRHSARVS